MPPTNYEESDYVCCLSGGVPKVNSLVDDLGDDELEDLPIGWVRVTFQRRLQNTKWTQIQKVKGATIEQMMTSVDDDIAKEIRQVIELQVEAQYAVLEASTPQFLIEEKVTFIGDPDDNSQLQSAYEGVLKSLDLIEAEVPQ